MIKSRLLTGLAALLTSVWLSAGDLDGQALICVDAIYPVALIEGTQFRDGAVFLHAPEREGSEAIIREWRQGNAYEVKTDTVEWQSADNFFELDRFTLRLEMFPMTGVSVWQAWQCELMDSLEAYGQVLEQARVELQARIAERIREGN
jgi:hypothetical protein